MPFITDSELFEEMYVNSEGIDLESNHLTGFPLEKNETFTYGTNFHYQQNSDIIFTAEYTPVDDEDERLSEDAVQAKAKTQIK